MSQPAPATPTTTSPSLPKDVYFFATCVVDQFHPGAGLDAITLLESLGLTVHFPENQTCCGQPAYSSGFRDDAKKVAAQQLDLFPEPWPIIIPSGSCGGMMKNDYPKLFADDADALAKATAISRRVFELTQFLVEIMNYQPKDQGLPCTVALHTSCAARREMGVHVTGRALLERLSNVQIAQQDHESECCGFGGTFSVRQPEISAAMVEDKVNALKACGAERVVSADCGCLLNILNHSAWKDSQKGKETPSLPGEHIASFLLRRTQS